MIKRKGDTVMNYVISDIHGHYDKYMEMLTKIKFKLEDTLFVLGDVLDRGPDGIKILKDMMLRPNVFPILGNHEYMAAMCIPWVFREVTDEEIDAIDEGIITGVTEWLSVGGESTINDPTMRDSEVKEMILEYLEEFTMYEVVKVRGKKFVLVHAGFDNFALERDLDEYHLSEMLFHSPDFDKVYFEDAFLVTGHTPTRAIWAKEQGKSIEQLDEKDYKDIIFKKNNHIAIDCGCAYGGKLACLCLETMEEFYV